MVTPSEVVCLKLSWCLSGRLRVGISNLGNGAATEDKLAQNIGSGRSQEYCCEDSIAQRVRAGLYLWIISYRNIIWTILPQCGYVPRLVKPPDGTILGRFFCSTSQIYSMKSGRVPIRLSTSTGLLVGFQPLCRPFAAGDVLPSVPVSEAY
jgi:hypothetical protein